MKISLKEIINKSFSLFNNEISSSLFIDTYSVVSNFFLRISIFLSNQSNGKYSETIINLFLRCLIRMNSINVKNEKLINYMNTKYKEDKNKIRQEIYTLNKKNEILIKTKIVLDNKIKELENRIKIDNNESHFSPFKIIKNINNYKVSKIGINEKNANNNLVYNEKDPKNQKITKDNYKIENSYSKKSEIREIFKNKFQKIYKEDIVEIKNHHDKIFNENNLNINYKENINNITINKESKNNEKYTLGCCDKSYETFIKNINNININEINLNDNNPLKSYVNINEAKKINNMIEANKEIINKDLMNRIKYNSNINRKEKINNKEIRKIEGNNINIKKYNTINYHDFSSNDITKREYISPQVNNKIQSYYKDNILNEKNMKNIKANQKIFDRLCNNKIIKGVNKEQKKKLNFYYYTKKINNNIISYNDINKNMKCDLAKKIKYLDRINKSNSNTNSNTKKSNIKNNNDKIICEQNDRYKRLLTEKKEKNFKYNFFDIIQETNKKRNNSGESKFKNFNNLSNNNNYISRLKMKNGSKINNNINIKGDKNYEHLVKSDYASDKTKSYLLGCEAKKNSYTISYPNSKCIKNGIENENYCHNGSDNLYINNQFDFSKKYKTNNIENKNKGKFTNMMINKKLNKKQDLNTWSKKNIYKDRNQYYHCNKNSNNSGKKENYSSSEFKLQSFKKEKNLKKILNKDYKKNNIYFIITESRNNTKNNKFLGALNNKNENVNENNSKSKSTRSEISKKKNNKNGDKGFNSYTKSKNRISNFNYKFNKTLLLKRSLSTTLNKLFTNNLQKKTIIDSYNENYNNSSSNNSFNVSNSLGVSYLINNKKKEIIAYNDNFNKSKVLEPIANLKIGLKNSLEINKDSNNINNKKKNIKSGNYDNNIIKEDYNSLLNEFKKNLKETFCYFKIIEKDNKNNNKFNPLDNCSISPEIFGYTEGYISIDINTGFLKIIPKIINYQNSNSNNTNNNIENELITKIKAINSNYNGHQIIKSNKSDNKVKDYCLNIELNKLINLEQTILMNNIIKIHRIFIKYNSGQINNNNIINNNPINDKKVLNLNKLIYVREIKEINMSQNEKIKAILCNFFSFSIIFGKYNDKTEIELIFINFEQYSSWNKFINTIIDLNKNRIKFDDIDRKKSNNNSKDYSHIKGNIENGSNNINEEISKLSNNNDMIVNV